jgi:hypothetical protein
MLSSGCSPTRLTSSAGRRRARCWVGALPSPPRCDRIRPVIILLSPRGAVAYLVAVPATFDPDDYELRWPPQLFVDEAKRLQDRKSSLHGGIFSGAGWGPDVEWLLTEAFVSTAPADLFKRVQSYEGSGGRDPRPEQWLSQLIREAATWPEPGTRKPYWSARTTGRTSSARMEFRDVKRNFVQVIDQFEADGYLAHAFGQDCVDSDGPPPDPSAVVSGRLGYAVEWPPGRPRAAWTLDQLCDLIEVLHDLVARPSSRWYHDHAGCGWHYSAFATRPARRLYRWRVNRMLAASTLGLRLADSGEDLGRLVRVEPAGLEDLSEKALQAATPETVDRVQHAIALFRSRHAGVAERRSAIIALAGILEERRDLLKAELLTKDEAALFLIANTFAIRHQRADQRGDYDTAFLDWLFWWYLGTVELTDQLLARQASTAIGGL